MYGISGKLLGWPLGSTIFLIFFLRIVIENYNYICMFDFSFDEASMDNTSLAIFPGSDDKPYDKKVNNEIEVTSLEEAKLIIAALRARQRTQTHQILTWRRTLKLQVSKWFISIVIIQNLSTRNF